MHKEGLYRHGQLKCAYQTPSLIEHDSWQLVTGGSVGINSDLLNNPFEDSDTWEEQ
jgi:hypothetical protein